LKIKIKDQGTQHSGPNDQGTQYHLPSREQS
jgi:hypothetical protein